ncbi:hypothetical protein ACJIZ3_011716 [Penstemon smallii]|uniref:F-box domain-containing protein n=1 Tax=Penstemon smallii TaxID=265156 RepID=A0ABD3UJX0_9LAMI
MQVQQLQFLGSARTSIGGTIRTLSAFSRNFHAIGTLKLLHPSSNLFCVAILVAAEKVEGIDDVLMSILVLLPPKSVFRFRCVSNRWNNIITNSYFLESYHAMTKRHGVRGRRLLAFAQFTSTNLFRTSPLEYNKLVLDKLGNFINSSNGLILCGESYSSNTYHVWNPLTKKFVSLPPPINLTREITSVAFVCEENTYELAPNSYTGTWAMSTLVISTGDFYLCEDVPPPFVCNGVVHWSGWRSIALYDLNGGENHLQLIMLPLPDHEYYVSSLTRSEHDDVLWFGITGIDHRRMLFYMLPKININDGSSSYRHSTKIPANEWRLMHTVSSDSLHKEPAIKLPQDDSIPIWLEQNYSKPIWLEGLIPCNPIVVVLRQGKRVFLYNLETKSIESLQYDGDRRPTKWWYPYMETLYLSSYAL